MSANWDHPYECDENCADCKWDELEADDILTLECGGCGDDVDRDSAHLHNRCHTIADYDG